jgi:hypothetical protein
VLIGARVVASDLFCLWTFDELRAEEMLSTALVASEAAFF